MQEERRAEQRRHDAELELGARRQQPDRDVGECREQRAAQEARQQQAARVMADGAAQQMRHDEADEADDARDGDGAADGERRAADDERIAFASDRSRGSRPYPRRASAHRGRAPRPTTSSQPGTMSGSGEIHVGEAAVGERAEHPEQDLERCVRARREVQRERGQRRGQRVDRDAREHDRQEIAAPARERIQRGEREQRAADGAERQQQRRGAREPK